FVSLFGPDDLTAGLRSMVFQQFDKRLPKVLGELYEKANAILEAAAFSGVAPEARRAAPGPRPPVATPQEDAAGWVPDGGVVPHIGSGGGTQAPRGHDEAGAGAGAAGQGGGYGAQVPAAAH